MLDEILLLAVVLYPWVVTCSNIPIVCRLLFDLKSSNSWRITLFANHLQSLISLKGQSEKIAVMFVAVKVMYSPRHCFVVNHILFQHLYHNSKHDIHRNIQETGLSMIVYDCLEGTVSKTLLWADFTMFIFIKPNFRLSGLKYYTCIDMLLMRSYLFCICNSEMTFCILCNALQWKWLISHKWVIKVCAARCTVRNAKYGVLFNQVV